MADQTRTTDGGLNRDRMGQRIQQSLSELDAMVAELLGSDEVSGQFDRITRASTTYLDDWVDGHQDGDDSLFAALDRTTAQPGGIDSAQAAVPPVEQVAQTSPSASASRPTPPAVSVKIPSVSASSFIPSAISLSGTIVPDPPVMLAISTLYIPSAGDPIARDLAIVSGITGFG